jgi:hypothetical protein
MRVWHTYPDYDSPSEQFLKKLIEVDEALSQGSNLAEAFKQMGFEHQVDFGNEDGIHLEVYISVEKDVSIVIYDFVADFIAYVCPSAAHAFELCAKLIVICDPAKNPATV